MKIKAQKVMRLDNYLNEELDISRSQIQKLIQKGNILVNNSSVKNSYMLKIDDEIDVTVLRSVILFKLGHFENV